MISQFLLVLKKCTENSVQILYLFILGDIICNLTKTVITIEGWK